MALRRRQEMMEENREKLISAGRKAFGTQGFAAASMDELTASVGLTRGALYHNFGDKKGLLAAVVAQVDGEMAAASGTTTYNALARPGYEGEYSNVFLLRFDADGRCAEFREWWMPRPRPRPAA